MRARQRAALSSLIGSTTISFGETAIARSRRVYKLNRVEIRNARDIEIAFLFSIIVTSELMN